MSDAFDIATERKKKGLTQEQVAEIVGCHQSAICRAEIPGRVIKPYFLKAIREAIQNAPEPVPSEEVPA